MEVNTSHIQRESLHPSEWIYMKILKSISVFDNTVFTLWLIMAVNPLLKFTVVGSVSKVKVWIFANAIKYYIHEGSIEKFLYCCPISPQCS